MYVCNYIYVLYTSIKQLESLESHHALALIFQEEGHRVEGLKKLMSESKVIRTDTMAACSLDHRSAPGMNVFNTWKWDEMGIWGFPKIWILPNHPFIIYRGFFHYKPSIWDTPIKMETLIWMGSSLFYIYLPHCLISPRLGIDRQQRRGSSEADLIISDGSVFGNPRNFGHFFSGNTFPEFV